MTSQFISNAAHEIRTPVSAITGFAAQILSEYIPALRDLLVNNTHDSNDSDIQNDAESRIQLLQSLENAVDSILTNADFLSEITDDILELAGTDLDTIDTAPKLKSVKLIPFIKYSAEMCTAVLRNSRVNISVKTTTPTPEEITTDSKRLKQVLVNLLSNAIKYTLQGNVNLEISCDKTGLLLFVVEDTGLGISPEFMSKLFVPFARDAIAIKSGVKGTGLGLSITKRILDSLGGSITVQSTPGKGSRFTVAVPVQVASGTVFVEPKQITLTTQFANNVPKQHLPKQYSNLAGAEILLVDDAPDIRRLFTAILTKAGAYVSEAEDGETAVEKTNARMKSGKMFDLILVDMRLPRINGTTTVAQMRKNGCVAPIVALSAFSDEDEISKCKEAGCDDYLCKPLTREELLSGAETAISNGKNRSPFNVV